MLLSALGQGQSGVSGQKRGRDEASRRGGFEASRDSISKERMDKVSCGFRSDIRNYNRHFWVPNISLACAR